MANGLKTALLGVSLLAGSAFCAYAQSQNLAALPPDAMASPPQIAAPIGPSAVSEQVPGQPRDLWHAPDAQAHLGPAPNSDRSDSD